MEKLNPKEKDAQAKEMKTGLWGEASHLPCLELKPPKLSRLKMQSPVLL